MVNKKRLLFFVSFFLVISISYFFYRSSTILIWGDSPCLARELDDPHLVPNNTSGFIKEVIKTGFNSVDYASGGYRPLASMIAQFGVNHFINPNSSRSVWFLVIGCLIGILALLIFIIARRFVNSDLGALFAVFIFLTTPAFLSGSWIVYSGVQATVPIAICLGLLFYFKFTEAINYKKWIYLAGLIVILFFGPWVREFVGILSPLIIVCEFMRVKRITPLSLILIPFLLHAIFPMFIPKVFFNADIHLSSVFTIGNLGLQVTSTVFKPEELIGFLRHGLKWDVRFHFINLFSSFLLAVGLISLALAPIFMNGNCRAIYTDKYRRNGYLFLVIWFLLSFLPFLIIFTEQVHLAYATLPFSIILAMAIENLWCDIKSTNSKMRLFKYAVSILLLLGSADSLLNISASYRIVNGINNGILKVANWIKLNVPEDSVIVANALHLHDIYLYSDRHFIPYWTVSAGIPYIPGFRDFMNDESLELFLKKNNGKKRVYFLDIDYKFTPIKESYHAHRFVRRDSVKTKSFGQIHKTQIRYKFLDPLKYFTSREFIPVLFSPDLENDFYRGVAQDGTWLTREIYAEYNMYEVIGREVKDSMKDIVEVSSNSSSKFGPSHNVIDGNRSISFWESTEKNSSWLQFYYKKLPKSPVVQYTFHTGVDGNDALDRMPVEWVLQGSKNGKEWITLDTRLDSSRWKINEKRSYTVSNKSRFQYVRFLFPGGTNPEILRIYEISIP